MISKILNGALPRRCAFCNSAVKDKRVCVRCDDLLPRVGNTCERCAATLADVPRGDVVCGACQRTPPPFARARAAFEYAFPIDTALKSLKFNRQLHYVPVFSAALLTILQRELDGVDALVPMPLHRWRYALRGFNQAYELCKPLARASRLPVVRNVRRVKPTVSQTGLNAAERRRNLAQAFAVSGRLRYSRLLIVDDVMTTGETCRQLALTLLAAGATQVDVLIAARA